MHISRPLSYSCASSLLRKGWGGTLQVVMCVLLCQQICMSQALFFFLKRTYKTKSLILALTRNSGSLEASARAVSWCHYSCEPVSPHWCYFTILPTNQRTPCQCCCEGLHCGCVTILLRLFSFCVCVCLLRCNNSRELKVAVRTKGRLGDLYEAFKALWWVKHAWHGMLLF